jgi:A/G-specific adenine glycosylase
VAWIGQVRDALAGWYDTGLRDHPWREERDAYRVLVSETMLVQTTVAAVAPFYRRFLDQFPTVSDLARAEPEAVLRAWEGLGYYRRARQLHAAAREIVARHQGEVPADEAALRALPGVGPYITGAIRSFAFDLPAPILEANSERVLARLLACAEPLNASSTRNRLWQAAARLVPADRPGRFNQALMDLGATVCTPRAPSCLLCPLRTHCQAHRQGLQDTLPTRSPRPTPQEVHEACVLVARDDQWLLARRAPGLLWEGFWEFPTIHREGPDPGRRRPDDPADRPTTPAEAFRAATGLAIEIDDPPLMTRYTVTRYRVSLAAHLARPLDPRTEPRPGPGYDACAWHPADAIPGLALPAPHRKLWKWICSHG